MKKIISIFAILSLAAVTVLAQATSASDLFAVEPTTVTDTKKNVEAETGNAQKPVVTVSNTNAQSIGFDLPEELLEAIEEPWENADTIANLTSSFSMGQKEALFNDYAKDKGKAIGLNWVGFGIGSFTQGDVLGGVLGVTFDVLAYGSVSVGAGIGLVYILADALTLGLAGDELGPYIALGGGLMLTGGILWLGNRIFGTIRPISFQKKYNSSLKSALGLDGIVDDISFVPVVDPVNSQFGLLTHITF
ncbi:MAG: P13 family porin [Treponema sp.]|nr:P13 family porin [Treponema sp.]